MWLRWLSTVVSLIESRTAISRLLSLGGDLGDLVLTPAQVLGAPDHAPDPGRTRPCATEAPEHEASLSDFTLSTSASPPAREAPGFVYDSRANLLEQFGGWNGSSFLSDTWELPG